LVRAVPTFDQLIRNLKVVEPRPKVRIKPDNALVNPFVLRKLLFEVNEKTFVVRD
jgi:hypothetical protein